jgi:hypothetical protein
VAKKKHYGPNGYMLNPIPALCSFALKREFQVKSETENHRRRI